MSVIEPKVEQQPQRCPKCEHTGQCVKGDTCGEILSYGPCNSDWKYCRCADDYHYIATRRHAALKAIEDERRLLAGGDVQEMSESDLQAAQSKIREELARRAEEQRKAKELREINRNKLIAANLDFLIAVTEHNKHYKCTDTDRTSHTDRCTRCALLELKQSLEWSFDETIKDMNGIKFTFTFDIQSRWREVDAQPC